MLREEVFAPLRVRGLYLSAVGQLIDGQIVVQAQGKSEITQAAGQVAFHQDVGALDVPVCDGHFGAPAAGVVAVKVRHSTGQGTPQHPQVMPVKHMVNQVLLQVPRGVVGRDQPELPLRLSFFRCQEVQHIVVFQIGVGEDFLLVLPGSVLLARENLDGHRLKALLPADRGALLELGLVHLCKASFPDLNIQINGQQLRVVVEVVGVRGATVGASIVYHNGSVIAEVQGRTFLAP